MEVKILGWWKKLKKRKKRDKRQMNQKRHREYRYKKKVNKTRIIHGKIKIKYNQFKVL